MKKITKKISFKKIFGIAALCLGLNQITVAQCSINPSYTYTTGSAGLVNFTNTSTGATANTIYRWYFGDGGAYSSVTSPSHTFQYNGSYFVNLSMWDTSGNCFDSTSQTINITNGLTCNIAASFSYIAGSGGQLNFTNTSANAPSNASYSWGFGDGTGSNQSSPSHTYFYNGTYSVQLYVSDSSGFCTNSTAQTVTVTNGNVCNLNVNYTYTLGTNGQAFFTNTTTGSDTSGVIHWDFGDGASTQLSPTHAFQYNGTYYVNLQMGDSLSPCYGYHTDTITITNAANAPVCGAYFTDSTLMGPGTIYFTNMSWGNSGTTIYSWSFGDGSTSNTMSPSHSYAYNGVYSVTLSMSDSANSCSSYYTDTVTITTMGPPPCVASVSFNMHQDSLNPQPGIWEASASYSSQVTSAVWNWGDGTSTSGLNPTHTYTVAGHYNICVMAIASCGDTSTVCQNDSLFRANGTNSVISVTVINTTATTGIKTTTHETAQVSIYPNPSAGVFTLSLTNVAAAKAQINISNILGEVIYSTQEQVSNGTIAKQIDLESTANGAYFMKVSVGNQTYTSKIIINK